MTGANLGKGPLLNQSPEMSLDDFDNLIDKLVNDEPEQVEVVAADTLDIAVDMVAESLKRCIWLRHWHRNKAQALDLSTGNRVDEIEEPRGEGEPPMVHRFYEGQGWFAIALGKFDGLTEAEMAHIWSVWFQSNAGIIEFIEVPFALDSGDSPAAQGLARFFIEQARLSYRSGGASISLPIFPANESDLALEYKLQLQQCAYRAAWSLLTRPDAKPVDLGIEERAHRAEVAAEKALEVFRKAQSDYEDALLNLRHQKQSLPPPPPPPGLLERLCRKVFNVADKPQMVPERVQNAQKKVAKREATMKEAERELIHRQKERDDCELKIKRYRQEQVRKAKEAKAKEKAKKA